MVVLSVQFVPVKKAHVTFEDDKNKEFVERYGFITINDVRCKILGVGPQVQNVMLYHYPYEESDDKLKLFLKSFGDVRDIKYQHYVGLSPVSTGTRIVTMLRHSNIPRNLNIAGHRCKVWYVGQPVECDICRGGHISKDCPMRGKCRKCQEQGHMARDCQNLPRAWGPFSSSVDPPPAASGGPSQPATANGSAPGDSVDMAFPGLGSSTFAAGSGMSSGSSAEAPPAVGAVAGSQAGATAGGLLPSWGSRVDLTTIDTRDNELSPPSCNDNENICENSENENSGKSSENENGNNDSENSLSILKVNSDMIDKIVDIEADKALRMGNNSIEVNNNSSSESILSSCHGPEVSDSEVPGSAPLLMHNLETEVVNNNTVNSNTVNEVADSDMSEVSALSKRTLSQVDSSSDDQKSSKKIAKKQGTTTGRPAKKVSGSPTGRLSGGAVHVNLPKVVSDKPARFRN